MFQLGDRNCEHSRTPPELATFERRLAAVGELLVTRDGVTVAMLAEAMLPRYASALQIAEQDKRIRGDRITYD
jgi:hypothetical protein